jgi:hypothetical protein
MDSSDVWGNLHDLFDCDDGSLPEIELTNLTGNHIGDVFLYLTNQGQDITINGALFWDKITNQSRSITSVDNAASLVVQYLAEPFHMVIGNLKSKKIIIPPLGLFVFQESISLDYRKGSHWNPENIAALLELLCEINRIAPEVQISLQEGESQSIQDKFKILWQQFKREYCR